MPKPDKIDLKECLIIGKETHTNAFIFELKKSLVGDNNVTYKYLVAFYKKLKATKKNLIDEVLKAKYYRQIQQLVARDVSSVGEDNAGDVKPKSIHLGNGFSEAKKELVEARVERSVRGAKIWVAPEHKQQAACDGIWFVDRNKLRSWRRKIFVSDTTVAKDMSISLGKFTYHPLKPNIDWLTTVIDDLKGLVGEAYAGCDDAIVADANKFLDDIEQVGLALVSRCACGDAAGVKECVLTYEDLVRVAIGRCDESTSDYIRTILKRTTGGGARSPGGSAIDAIHEKFFDRLLKWGRLYVRTFGKDVALDTGMRRPGDKRCEEVDAGLFKGLGAKLYLCGTRMGPLPTVEDDDLKNLSQYGEKVRAWWVKIYDFLGPDVWSSKGIVVLDKYFERVCTLLSGCVEVNLASINRQDMLKAVTWRSFPGALYSKALSFVPSDGDLDGFTEQCIYTYQAIVAGAPDWMSALKQFGWLESYFGPAVWQDFYNYGLDLIERGKLWRNGSRLGAKNCAREVSKVRAVFEDKRTEGKWLRKFLVGLSESQGLDKKEAAVLDDLLGVLESARTVFTAFKDGKEVSDTASAPGGGASSSFSRNWLVATGYADPPGVTQVASGAGACGDGGTAGDAASVDAAVDD